MFRSHAFLLIFTLLLPVASHFALPSGAAANGARFVETWNRTDLPVADGVASRTWIWGQQLTDVVSEPYSEAPGGSRQIQYFDKSRMEITNPDGDTSSPWYGTNGLLVVELVTGRMQVGDDDFLDYPPSEANVAGDQHIGYTVEYHYLARYLDAPARTEGALITELMGSLGSLHRIDDLAGHNVTAGQYDPVTRHSIATPFWEFMNSTGTVWDGREYVTASLFENPYFATGHPITEAYWTNTRVAGTSKTVLFQCFERRCLTYTPDNPAGWLVEAGNVGQHYLEWRTEMLGRVGDGGYAYTGTLTADGFATGAATVPQQPGQVAVTADGTMFLIDDRTQELLIYDPTGELVARHGDEPYGRPAAIALDGEDAVLLAIGGGFQRIDTDGRVLAEFAENLGTVPGTPTMAGGFDVDRYGNFYYADIQNNGAMVRKFNARGDLIGLIESPTYDSPTGVAVGPDGALYVSTRHSNELHRFLASGEYAGTFVADGCVAVSYVTVDHAGNVYSACEDFVLKQAPDGSRLAFWGGPGVEVAKFDGIAGIAVDQDGRTFVSDAGNERVQVFDSDGGYLLSLPQPLPSVVEGANVNVDPDEGLIVVSGSYYDSSTLIQVLDSEGRSLQDWTPGERGNPRDLAVGANDAAYLLYQDAVDVYSLDGAFQSTTTLVPDDQIQGEVWSIEVDGAGNVYLLDSGLIQYDEANVPSAIVKYDSDGRFVARWETKRSGFGADVNYFDMAFDGSSLLVATYDGLIRLDTETGTELDHWPDATGVLVDVDAAGNVYLGREPDYGNIYKPWIRMYAPDGSELAAWGVTGPGEGRINNDLATLAVGPSGVVYIVDYERVQRFSQQQLRTGIA